MDDDSSGLKTKALSPTSGSGVGNGLADGSQQAADIAREQIKRIYDQGEPNTPKEDKATKEPAEEAAKPKGQSTYNRTHKNNFDWREYHSAWQAYYQEYYRRYYHHLNNKKTLQKPAEQKAVAGDDGAGVAELKRDIVSQVKHQASRFRRSSHFWPLVTACIVGLLFLFVQFNSVLIAQVESYVSPGALEGKNLVINDPVSSTKVGPESRLIIPKINVDMPVNFDINTLDEAKIQTALRDAAVQYKIPGASVLPGQYGNSVILGHSSNDVFAQGKYKFAFVLADRLVPGDTFYVHYNGTRYTYKVTGEKVIKPEQIYELQTGYDKPMVTLVTCTPAGTSLNRLLIFGEQINPDPQSATKVAEENQSNTAAAVIPGNAPTLFEQLWGLFF